MNNRQQFQTTSIHLAAALLVCVPGAALDHVTADAVIDGRRSLVIVYSEEQESVVRDVVNQFHDRQLRIALYDFNRCLNAVRDKLRQGQGSCAAR